MANIGEALIEPENGWRRYLHNHESYTYNGPFLIDETKYRYIPSGESEQTIKNSSIDFKFTGKKLRLLAYRNSAYSSGMVIIVDGISYDWSCYGDATHYALLFDKMDFSSGLHTVKIKSEDGVRYSFAGVDIDEFGELHHIDYELPSSENNRVINLGSMKQILTSVNDKIESMPGKTIINEVSNPLLTEPLEFGYFIMTPQEIDSINTVVQIEAANSNMNTLENAISLKKGKDYRINANIGSITSSNEGEWLFRFCDKETDERIGLDLMTIVVETASDYVGHSANTEFIYTPLKDMDIVLKSISDGNIEIEIGSVNIQEIRSNPVNQYGGFESQVIFEGEANALSTYTLADDVSNYNTLIVEAKCYTADGSLSYPISGTTRLIQTDNIKIGLDQQFAISEYAMTSAYFRISFSCTKQNEIKIYYLSNSDYWGDCFISRIIGVNGQLPSLLSGGEF